MGQEYFSGSFDRVIEESLLLCHESYMVSASFSSRNRTSRLNFSKLSDEQQFRVFLSFSPQNSGSSEFGLCILPNAICAARSGREFVIHRLERGSQ
jgi:hypothetical protein